MAEPAISPDQTRREVAQVHDAPLEVTKLIDTVSLMQVISRAASDPNTDVEKMERLMSLYERLQDREAEKNYSEAMNAAQEEMRPVSQNAANPQTKSKYADYAALDKVLRPIYTKHGFSISFDTGEGAPENYVRVICKVRHRGGNRDSLHLDIPADGKGAKGGDVMTKTHAVMSAVTYGKRGLLKMVFNIAEGDDDGNGAGTSLITEDQAATIFQLLKSSGADREKFLSYIGAESVPDIMAKDFNRACAALRAKAKKK